MVHAAVHATAAVRAPPRPLQGKTLVAVLPAYLNALTGKGVHVVTVNDYLARRDSEWVGQVHRFLGLKVRPPAAAGLEAVAPGAHAVRRASVATRTRVPPARAHAGARRWA